jgi:Zn-finger nucleic acid-binding protein
MAGYCFHCSKALEESQVDYITVRMCPPCASVLIHHPDLMQIVDQSWRAVPRETAAAETFHASAEKPTTERAFHCPDCREPMEKYGYMGLNSITIDRCDGCSLVWLDANELQNMVLVYAREQYRLAERREKTKRESFDIVSAGITGAGTTVTSDMWLFRNRNRNPLDADNVLPLAVNLLGLLLRR